MESCLRGEVLLLLGGLVDLFLFRFCSLTLFSSRQAIQRKTSPSKGQMEQMTTFYLRLTSSVNPVTASATTYCETVKKSVKNVVFMAKKRTMATTQRTVVTREN